MRPRTISTKELLTVAREVFLEQGTAVSVQVIADKIGISQPALFKRFGTKENLIRRVFENPPKPEWLEIVEAGVTDEPLEEQLHRITNGLVTFFENLHPIMRIMKSCGISHFDIHRKGDEPLPNKGVRLLTNWFEECHTKGLIPETNYKMAAVALVGMIQVEVFTSFLAKKSGTDLNIDDEYIQHTVEFILNSIRGGE